MKNNGANLDDSVLVKKYQNGDLSAFDVLFERYYENLYKRIFFIMKKQDVSQDIIQDLFVKVIKAIKAGKYNEEGAFHGWIFRMAHNLCIDTIRKEKKIPTVTVSTSGNIQDVDGDILYPVPDPDLNPEDAMIHKEVGLDVDELLKCLPDEQKEVVYLRTFENFSFQEIAEYTNVSINTALGRMRYSLINIRKYIQEVETTGRKIL